MLKLFKVLFFVTASISLPATAGVINTYYENPGDNRAVYDDVTNLIWLDLSETAGLTQAEALNMFEGFTIATSAQAFGLIGDLSSTATPPNFQLNVDSVSSWFDLFGSSEANLETGEKGFGTACAAKYKCSFGATAQDELFGFSVDENDDISRLSALSVNIGSTPDTKDAKLSQIAWFLVADLAKLRAAQSSGVSSVSEPTAVILFTIILLLLSRRLTS